MAFSQFFDLVLCNTGTTGTSDAMLGAAVAPYLTPDQAGMTTGVPVSYSLIDVVSGHCEAGQGVATKSGSIWTISRATVKTSSNSGSKISLSGSATISIEVIAADLQAGLLIRNALPATPPAGAVALFSLVNLVASMTGNTTPSGWTASASSTYSITQPYMAFQSNVVQGSQQWLTNGVAAAQIEIALPAAKVALAYEFMGWSIDSWNTRVPTSWTFQGSNDGSTWTTLDTQTTQAATFEQWIPRQFYCLGNTTAYAYYRLNVSANNGNAYMGLSGFHIFGIGAPQSDQRPSIFSLDEHGNAAKLSSPFPLTGALNE